MYTTWAQENSEGKNPTELYDRGFVFTRRGKGEMDQTRSCRIRLSNFSLSSENRRILRKTEGLTLTPLPLPYPNYEWSIHKLGKDFYTEKFGDNTFSANKIKELMTDTENSNFNRVLTYTENDSSLPSGYAICFENESLLHYSYPFYDHIHLPKDTGLGMMIRAIEYAKEADKEYIYLGSLSRPTDTYKTQFAGFEWFDGNEWQTDITTLKEILND